MSAPFWQPIKMAPIEALMVLREIVTAKNPKRMPKWKFRLDNDLVAQMQPKPIIPKYKRPGFICEQIRFGKEVIVKFNIYTDDWTFQPTSFGWTGSEPSTACYLGSRDRVIELLPRLNRLDMSMMYQPNCLSCGRKLTDPVSQARFIGPECSGTATALNPYILRCLPDEHTPGSRSTGSGSQKEPRP